MSIIHIFVKSFRCEEIIFVDLPADVKNPILWDKTGVLKVREIFILQS